MNITALTRPMIGSPSSLMDYAEHLERLSSQRGPMLYRGQPQEYRNLSPTLARVLGGASYGAVNILERKLLSSFRTHYLNIKTLPADMPTGGQVSENSDIEVLSLMQHYEVPSRLLDWSESIWVAAYFACATDPGSNSELWYMDESLLNVAPDDLTTDEVKKMVSLTIGTHPGDNHEKWFGPFLAVIDPMINARLTAQEGKLTASNHATTDHASILWNLATRRHGSEDVAESFGRYVIRADRKNDILRFLDEQKDISARSLFPDIVGLGRFLRSEFESLRLQLL